MILQVLSSTGHTVANLTTPTLQTIFSSHFAELTKPFTFVSVLMARTGSDMAKVALTEKQKELIERAGIVFERDGFSPVAARTLSLLVVSDETELTFETIYQTLNISKSAASNAINLLLVARRIEYITKPGDRKRYFRTRLVQMETIYEEVFKDMDSEVAVFKEILAQRTTKTKAFNEGIRDFISFMEMIRETMPAIYQKWKKAKEK